MRSEQTNNDWQHLGHLSTQTRGYVKHIPRVELLERLIEAEDGNFQAAFVRWMEIVAEDTETLAQYPVAVLEAARGQYLLAEADMNSRRDLRDLRVERSLKREAAEVLLPHLGFQGSADYIGVPLWRFLQDAFLDHKGRVDDYLEMERLLKERRYSFNEIGRLSGFSSKVVSRFATVFGIKSGPNIAVEEAREKAVEMWRSGEWTHQAIANKLGVALGSVSRWLRYVDSPRKGQRGRRGARPPHPRRDEALELLKAGWKPRAVAEHLGIKHKTVASWATNLNEILLENKLREQ